MKIGRGRLENRPVKVKNFVSRVSISRSASRPARAKSGAEGAGTRRGSWKSSRDRSRPASHPRPATLAATSWPRLRHPQSLTEVTGDRPPVMAARWLTDRRRDPVSALINPHDRPRARSTGHSGAAELFADVPACPRAGLPSAWLSRLRDRRSRHRHPPIAPKAPGRWFPVQRRSCV